MTLPSISGKCALVAALAWLTALAGCSSNGGVAGAVGVGEAGSSDLPTQSPEAAGYSSTKLAALAPYVASLHSPAGAVLVGDKVIYAWGDLTAKMQVHSIRKSFLSSLYGHAVDGGQITLASTLADLGIDDLPPSLTVAEKQATVQDLLESRSGVYHDANYETATEIATRPARGSHPPGTFWYYNNWDFNAAGAVYEQSTHTSIFDAFASQIAGPIGMQDYSPGDGTYEVDQPSKSRLPAYLFNMSTRDMARFGLLYLHHGLWNGVQVVPAGWVSASLQSYSAADFPGNGYGYLWWIGVTGEGLFHGVDVGEGAFAAEGSGGHTIVVMPTYDMVIVTRADDAWYEQDEADNNIGPNRMGQIVSLILGAKNQ